MAIQFGNSKLDSAHANLRISLQQMRKGQRDSGALIRLAGNSVSFMWIKTPGKETVRICFVRGWIRRRAGLHWKSNRLRPLRYRHSSFALALNDRMIAAVIMMNNFSGRFLLFWVAILCAWTFAFEAMAAGETTYVVRKNDTLTAIARKLGVTTQSLSRLNGISRSGKIRPGDILRVPGSTRPTSKETTALPLLKQRLNQTPVDPHKWKYIVIHHSATSSGTAKGMDRYHREERHMENGLAYHFLIGNGRGMRDGEITVGRRWIDQIKGGHLKSEELNSKSIGICLVGNFDTSKPSSKQMESLEWLVDYLMNRCRLNVSALKTHQQINPVHTRCPGKNFPSQAFAREFQAAR